MAGRGVARWLRILGEQRGGADHQHCHDDERTALHGATRSMAAAQRGCSEWSTRTIRHVAHALGLACVWTRSRTNRPIVSQVLMGTKRKVPSESYEAKATPPKHRVKTSPSGVGRTRAA